MLEEKPLNHRPLTEVEVLRLQKAELALIANQSQLKTKKELLDAYVKLVESLRIDVITYQKDLQMAQRELQTEQQKLGVTEPGDLQQIDGRLFVRVKEQKRFTNGQVEYIRRAYGLKEEN